MFKVAVAVLLTTMLVLVGVIAEQSSQPQMLRHTPKSLAGTTANTTDATCSITRGAGKNSKRRRTLLSEGYHQRNACTHVE